MSTFLYQKLVKEVEPIMSFLNAFVVGPAFILGIVLIFFLICALLQWLWNITMPQVFNLKPITFWQALRLIIIAAILFGGPGFN